VFQNALSCPVFLNTAAILTLLLQCRNSSYCFTVGRTRTECGTANRPSFWQLLGYTGALAVTLKVLAVAFLALLLLLYPSFGTAAGKSCRPQPAASPGVEGPRHGACPSVRPCVHLPACLSAPAHAHRAGSGPGTGCDLLLVGASDHSWTVVGTRPSGFPSAFLSLSMGGE
jgi:hypothetical protein